MQIRRESLFFVPAPTKGRCNCSIGLIKGRHKRRTYQRRKGVKSAPRSTPLWRQTIKQTIRLFVGEITSDSTWVCNVSGVRRIYGDRALSTRWEMRGHLLPNFIHRPGIDYRLVNWLLPFFTTIIYLIFFIIFILCIDFKPIFELLSFCLRQ